MSTGIACCTRCTAAESRPQHAVSAAMAARRGDLQLATTWWSWRCVFAPFFAFTQLADGGPPLTAANVAAKKVGLRLLICRGGQDEQGGDQEHLRVAEPAPVAVDAGARHGLGRPGVKRRPRPCRCRVLPAVAAATGLPIRGLHPAPAFARRLIHYVLANKLQVGLAALALAAFSQFMQTPPAGLEGARDLISEHGSFAIYWLVLGILSSVGLGSGLHTFVLYLGPHILRGGRPSAVRRCMMQSAQHHADRGIRVGYGRPQTPLLAAHAPGTDPACGRWARTPARRRPSAG